MIVLGSYAALLRGDLPGHRGDPRDIDVWGTHQEALDFHAASSPMAGRGVAGQRLAWAIFPMEGGRLHVDFDIEQAAYRLAMPVLPEAVDLFGAPVSVITLPGQRAISLALAQRGQAKHQLDLAEWGSAPADDTLLQLFSEYLDNA